MSDVADDLYETDYVLWSSRQAEALRRRAANEIDWENVAEEIESLGRSDRRQVGNRILSILQHLMCLQASPSLDQRTGWRVTIVKSRQRLANLLDESPSLRPAVPGVIVEKLPAARKLAALSLEEHGEDPRIALERLTYDEEQVLGDWLP